MADNVLGEKFWDEIKNAEATNKPNKPEDNFLTNYIKYCLGYLRIQSASLRPSDLLQLDKNYFNLNEFININPEDFTSGLYINLPILEKFSPKNIPEKYKEKYEQEKLIAQKIEELISRYKNEEFTKEIILRFGKFTFSVPIELADKIRSKNGKRKNDEDLIAEETEYTDYLFYTRINLESIKGKYLVSLKDDKIFYDISIFEPIFQNENTYYDILKNLSDSEESLRFPARISLIEELSDLLLSKLRLTKILFSQKKIDLSENAFSITHKMNHFLTKDLEELASGDTTNISTTSLGSLSSQSDEDLNVVDDEVIKSGNILFPFAYNKSQINVLKHIKNKALVVEGPPGTGKSQTISNLLCHLASQNKRVLFVSQKQQALKVVKAKLATLNIDHLFGYLTNDMTEKDSYDTFSSSLERLKSDPSHFRNGNAGPSDIGQKIAEINERAILFNEGIKQQEELYKLNEKIKTYPKTYFPFEKFYVIANKFTIDKMQEYVGFKKTIDNYNEKIKKYTIEDKNDFLGYNKKFSNVAPEAWERNLSIEIEEMIDELKIFDYDNKFIFKKLFLKTQLAIAHQNNIEKLPREVSDILKKAVSSDFTLGSKIKIFESVKKYCQYQEDLINLELNRQNLNKTLIEYGLSSELADKLIDLILNSENPDKELSNFMEYNSMIDKIKEILPVDYSSMAKEINGLESRRQNLAAQYLANIIVYRSSAYNTIKASIRGKIVSFAKALKRSKRAFKTFERLRQDYEMFNSVSNIVPIWIMSLDDASRVLPLQSNLFDYVVLDEASQCNIAYALPSMYRAERVVIVGDPKQMRDDTVLFKKKSVLEDLANRFKIDEDRRIIGRFENLKSILDISLLRGIKSQFLERHYRSPRELIGFSNKNFYDNRLAIVNNSYLTYKDTNRVLINHVLKYENSKEDMSPATNYTEVKAIIKLIKELQGDPIYKDKSIAVLTFFNDQATLIRSEVQKEFGLEHDIKISVIEGIQGDERDIVMYSFVIHDPSQKMQYVALTGERGEVRPEITAGRVNVAFSRARKQVHCFTSLPVNEWPEGIWINKYLQYVENNGFVESQKEELRPFDSYFEEEFYNLVSDKFKGYIIRNQVPSCGYFIDFVIQNPKNNRTIAVECDGPVHDDQIESDIKRQLLLEQAGWRFLRIRYSDWIQENASRDSMLEDIHFLLEKSN